MWYQHMTTAPSANVDVGANCNSKRVIWPSHIGCKYIKIEWKFRIFGMSVLSALLFRHSIGGAGQRLSLIAGMYLCPLPDVRLKFIHIFVMGRKIQPDAKVITIMRYILADWLHLFDVISQKFRQSRLAGILFFCFCSLSRESRIQKNEMVKRKIEMEIQSSAFINCNNIWIRMESMENFFKMWQSSYLASRPSKNM